MFPEETLHCVEWAKDIFGNLFTLNPQSYNKVFFSQGDRDFNDLEELKNIQTVCKMYSKRPKTFAQCLEKARSKFQSYFVNKILQLIHVYPLDKVTGEGRPFWSLPKRAPTKIDFDPKNELHASFITAYACLFARMFSIPLPEEFASSPRSSSSK
jgi:hypothetical protein